MVTLWPDPIKGPKIRETLTVRLVTFNERHVIPPNNSQDQESVTCPWIWVALPIQSDFQGIGSNDS